MSSSKAIGPFLAALAALAAAGCVEKRLGPAGSGVATGLGAPPLVAQATPVPTPTPYFPQNRPLDERAPVKLRADHLRYDARSKETQFSGNVVARQDSTVLKADELRSADQGQSARAKGHLRLRDDRRRLEISASEGEYRDALGTAELRGGVVLHSQDPYALPVTVTGQTAWYQSLSRLAKVSGGVKVKRGTVLASAKEARLNGADGRMDLEGGVDMTLGKKNRVRSRRASLDQKSRDLAFEGEVEAKIIPAEIREAAAHPER